MASPEAPWIVHHDTSFRNPKTQSVSKNCSSGSLRRERLWQEYLRDSECWDNPSTLRAQSTKSINDSYNPGRVKYMLEKKESTSQGTKSSTGRSSSEDRVLDSLSNCKASVKSEVEMNTSKAQELHDNRVWERLSLEEALTSLEGISQLPSVDNIICILQKCRKEKNLAYAKRLLVCVNKTGLEAHRSLGNHLVPMLVECGSMCDALQVFNRLVDPKEYSWTSLIRGYIEFGEPQLALNLYHKMQEDGVYSSKYTLVALLKACARLKDGERGQNIHDVVARKALESDPFLGNTLVDMYAKCSLLAKAQLAVRDAVSWNALITGYAQHGLADEALDCFRQMQLEGVTPDAVTYICSLKACVSIRAIDTGQDVHGEIARRGLERDSFIGSTLVDMYAKCGMLAKAHEVIDKLSARNVVSWNALILGYSEHGLGEEALDCFEQMQVEGLSPNSVTYFGSLKACGSVGDIEKSQNIHIEIARIGVERDPYVANTLVDMYAKCGSLLKAREVFDKLPIRDVVSWNALIAGYAEHGLGEEGLKCFEHMKLEGVSPDAVTFVSSLKACGTVGAIDKGQEIHAEMDKRRFERDPFLGSSLVDMYAKCGLLAKAQEVFNKLPVRDVVLWSTLIAGYSEYGTGEEALNCFEQMKVEGVPPDAVTFAGSLKACGSIGAIERGQKMHAEISRKGLERDSFIGNTLVDMYAKCGSLAKARQVFDKLPIRNVISWNALIAGYAEHDFGEEALSCFEQMYLEGVSPDAVTFVSSLKACGSIGAIDEGEEIHAEIARNEKEREPLISSTLVDIYVKCGWLAKARECLMSFLLEIQSHGMHSLQDMPS